MEKQFDKTAASRSLPEITAGSYQRVFGGQRVAREETTSLTSSDSDPRQAGTHPPP